MSNLLRNPNLLGFTLGRYFTQQDGSVGTIEFPHEWEFQALPRDPADPEKLVQSLHRDQGFGMSAGFRSWEGGYIQRSVLLQANTRYLAKAAITPNVGFTDGNIDLTAITWRIVIESSAGTIAQDWQVTTKGGYGSYEEVYFPFHCTVDTPVTFQFWARSVYAGNSCELQVLGLSLEPVEPNFGGPNVPVISTPGTAPRQAPPPPVQPAPPPQPAARQGGSGSMGSMGAPAHSSPSGSIGMVPSAPAGSPSSEAGITDDDLAVIANGLRALSQITGNPVVTAGFERLIQVLEKLKK